jgi:hypothetical protein
VPQAQGSDELMITYWSLNGCRHSGDQLRRGLWTSPATELRPERYAAIERYVLGHSSSVFVVRSANVRGNCSGYMRKSRGKHQLQFWSVTTACMHASQLAYFAARSRERFFERGMGYPPHPESQRRLQIPSPRTELHRPWLQ